MLDFAIAIAREAGAVLREGLKLQRQIQLKSPFELVTDIDHASERLLVGAISARFPEHVILAEESGGSFDDERPTWLIDPLDGANNYAHGFPFFAVSLGLWADNKPVLGVVYDPMRDELFTAQAGAGAFCNGQRLQVSAVSTLAAALLSTGFPYDYSSRADNNLAEFDRLQSRCQGVRRAGSAALDLAYVASGRLEAHWEVGLKPWDTGAAALLVTEAGGRVTDMAGGDWQPWCPRTLASNGLIHDELIQVLNSQF